MREITDIGPEVLKWQFCSELTSLGDISCRDLQLLFAECSSYSIKSTKIVVPGTIFSFIDLNSCLLHIYPTTKPALVKV